MYRSDNDPYPLPSRLLNRRLLAKVVRLPMAFFDSQPTGRV